MMAIVALYKLISINMVAFSVMDAAAQNPHIMGCVMFAIRHTLHDSAAPVVLAQRKIYPFAQNPGCSVIPQIGIEGLSWTGTELPDSRHYKRKGED
jgi:hypothetical protein